MAYNAQPALGQTTMAGSLPVVIASNQTAVPVSGTFYQATQPISGTVTANAGTGTFTVTAIATNANGYSVATGSIGNTKTDIGTANTAGIVAGWYFYNPNNSVAYVQVFNLQASAVTLGTTAPVYSIGIPALSAANLMSPTGITHSTAISIAITTTRAGSTNVGSTVDYNIFYKQ